jgi:predicted DCC family thiol-disulfide oxidoreductase YuxK
MPRHNLWGERRGCTLLPAAGNALAVVTGRDPGDGRAVLAVFYNGNCVICRARVAKYQEASRGRSRLIAWCDVGRTPWALRRWGIDGGLARRRMHVVDASGRVHGGARAFSRLWRELPGYRALGHLIGLPGLVFVAEGIYRLKLATNPGLRAIDADARGPRHA